MKTVVEVLRQHTSGHPDSVALLYGGQTRTFADIDRRSTRAAGALRSAGIAPGDRVAFLDKNAPEFLELWLGACKLGAVLVPINWRLTAREVGFIIEDAGARLLVIGPEFDVRLGAAVETTVVVGAEFEAWLDCAIDAGASLGPAAHDLAAQMYTSGTTGLPKGALLTHANLTAQLTEDADAMGYDDSAVNLVVAPLFHIAGAVNLLLGLWVGCPTVLHREFVPDEVLASISAHRVTHTIFVPAVIQALLASGEIATTDVSTMRTIMYGASPISESVLDRAMATFGCDFVQAYGLTETTGTAVCLSREDHRRRHEHPQRIRSVGKALPGMELRVVDPASGIDQPVGTVGEVWLRGSMVTVGYWNRPDDTARAITDGGWLHTGDAGYLDADGYLYIHDRVKDMIISGAENVYPAEVENILMSHPGVADVAVIGIPDERWGEAVKAVIVRATGIQLTEAELIEWCRKRLAGFKCPTSVNWIDALPRSAAGKVLKRELREPYWAGKQRRVN